MVQNSPILLLQDTEMEQNQIYDDLLQTVRRLIFLFGKERVIKKL
jgi:hypothetical protein